ncbi:hypothetical protein [Actinacidiphila glaucinigra]|uniref:hypothetical protein n=1 Tax=Actinacidiphila glaucinigra TaxID=235986 RepID=UPI0035E22984
MAKRNDDELYEDAIPEVKLDSAAAAIEGSLTDEQRRGLFVAPGSRVMALVELRSVTVTKHADGEDKAPQVKVRVSLAEVARDATQTNALREVQRAMYRSRKIAETLDEAGDLPDPDAAIAEALASMPTEGEFRDHQARRAARQRANEASLHRD